MPSIEPSETLTDRESEIVESLIVGATAREVARELRLSFHTVRTHIRNIYQKLGVANRIELLRWREDNSDIEVSLRL
jgi:DNA-binding NarL/FixJ family response regulator